MALLLIALLLSTPPQSVPTLSAELLERNLPAPRDAADLQQPITSHAVFDDGRWFVIAYYEQAADGLLHELRVRSYDKRAMAWHGATFEAIGSILSIARHAGLTYVEGHSSPSAAPLLVLSDDLHLKHTLDGWPKLFLPDGRVVFQRSMRHFMPTHAAALALYDPRSNVEQALFPDAAIENDRGSETAPGSRLALDRSIDSVTKGAAPGTISFEMTEQKRRLTPQGSDPAGPEEHITVTCRVTTRVPSCRRAHVPLDSRKDRVYPSFVYRKE